MEQLFFAGKAYLKINSLVKTPLHEFMAVERSGLWAPGCTSGYARAFVCVGTLPLLGSFRRTLIFKTEFIRQSFILLERME